MRARWLLLLLLCPASLAAQLPSRNPSANAWILWDDLVELHATSSYEATITSVVGGVAVRRVQPVVPLSREECQMLAVLRGEAWMPVTQCADVCVSRGDMTVTLTASTPGPWLNPSGPSNEGHGDVPRACGPSPPPPPPQPPPPTFPAWAVGAGAVAVSGASTLGGANPTLPELVNRQCVTWRITAPCLCGFPPSPCVQVEYWEPTSLIEIVKQPGTSAVPILGDLLKAGLQVLGVSLFGGGGASSSAGAGQTNLHYAEAHVWSFPQIFGGPCTACAPVNALPRLQYASEADYAAWRMTAAPMGIPTPALLPVGAWGTLFPRVGFVTHSSPPVASGLQAFRALNIAFAPVTPLPTPEAHIAISPAEGLTGCMQLAWPKQTPCVLAGTPPVPPVPWDAGATSAKGAYIWIVWSKRVCCVPPPGTCGITTPGVGLHGQNMCPM